ncbi:hypothetical protein ACLOJK_011690 [Asimina triloba]
MNLAVNFWTFDQKKFLALAASRLARQNGWQGDVPDLPSSLSLSLPTTILSPTLSLRFDLASSLPTSRRSLIHFSAAAATPDIDNSQHAMDSREIYPRFIYVQQGAASREGDWWGSGWAAAKRACGAAGAVEGILEAGDDLVEKNREGVDLAAATARARGNHWVAPISGMVVIDDDESDAQRGMRLRKMMF